MMTRVRVGASILAVLAGAVGCGGKAGPAATTDARPKAVPVTVATVDRRPVERTVEAVGTLRGWEDVVVGSKRGGRVARVRADIGDRVRPGDPLVDLEVVDADLAVEQAGRRLQAELAGLGLRELPTGAFDIARIPAVVRAQVALDRVRLNLARERSLVARGAGTAQDFQNAENDLKGAEAALDGESLTARATLASALSSKVALDVAKQARVDMEVRVPSPSAPPPGRDAMSAYAVAKRSASEGQMLKEGDPVAELIIEDPLRLWINVPERSTSEVKIGQPVRVRVASHPDRVFEGKVARINPRVDSASRTFQVETTVPNPDGLLRPGGFAKASILAGRDDRATTVPIESIVRFAGVTKVFLVEGDRARSVQVELGLEGPGWVEILGPLPTGAPVVVTGQGRLADGTLVAIRKPEPAKKATVPRPEAELMVPISGGSPNASPPDSGGEAES